MAFGVKTGGWEGGGGSTAVFPYMGFINICGPKVYGFSAILVINRVSIWLFWS